MSISFFFINPFTTFYVIWILRIQILSKLVHKLPDVVTSLESSTKADCVHFERKKRSKERKRGKIMQNMLPIWVAAFVAAKES